MEGSKEDSIAVVVYEAQIREPFMGNIIPISILLYVEKGKVIFIEVENPEKMKITAKEDRTYYINAKAFHRATTGLPRSS